MVERQIESPKGINLFYNNVERHYHMIVNITGALRRSTYVMHVTKHAEVTPHIAVTRHLVIVSLGLRSPFPLSQFPPPSTIDILEAKRVSRNTDYLE